MEDFSYVLGSLWDEFKSLNYSSCLIEQHNELVKEVLAFYEICKDFLEVEFRLSKVQLAQNVVDQLNAVEFIKNDLGFEVISKEISHFEMMKSTLSSVLMLPKEKAQHHIRTMFPVRVPSPPAAKQLVITSKGYTSSLCCSKIEAFLLKRYDSFN